MTVRKMTLASAAAYKNSDQLFSTRIAAVGDPPHFGTCSRAVSWGASGAIKSWGTVGLSVGFSK